MNLNKYDRNIGSNEFNSNGIELAMNSNKYTRNIGLNELDSDGIELAANSNKYTRNIGSNELDSDGIERVANLNKYTRMIEILVRMNSIVIKIGMGSSWSRIRASTLEILARCGSNELGNNGIELAANSNKYN